MCEVCKGTGFVWAEFPVHPVPVTMARRFIFASDATDIHSLCDVTCMKWTLIRLDDSRDIQVSSGKHIHHCVALQVSQLAILHSMK
jgi:hypothetical protein